MPGGSDIQIVLIFGRVGVSRLHPFGRWIRSGGIRGGRPPEMRFPEIDFWRPAFRRTFLMRKITPRYGLPSWMLRRWNLRRAHVCAASPSRGHRDRQRLGHRAAYFTDAAWRIHIRMGWDLNAISGNRRSIGEKSIMVKTLYECRPD